MVTIVRNGGASARLKVGVVIVSKTSAEAWAELRLLGSNSPPHWGQWDGPLALIPTLALIR